LDPSGCRLVTEPTTSINNLNKYLMWKHTNTDSRLTKPCSQHSIIESQEIFDWRRFLEAVCSAHFPVEFS
jgi:hypothetical protein